MLHLTNFSGVTFPTDNHVRPMNAVRTACCYALFILAFATQYAHAGARCWEELATLYAGSPNAQKAIEALSQAAQEKIIAVFEQSNGDYVKEMVGLSEVFMSEFRAGLPDALKPLFDRATKDYQVHRTESTSANVAEDLAQLKSDPVGALIRGLREREEADNSVYQASVPREMYGVRAAFYLELMKEVQRLTHLEMAPAWRKIPVVAISNPLPADTIDRFRQFKILSARQWDYLNLVPPKHHPKIYKELEVERDRFLTYAKHADQKAEIEKQFDEMKKLIQDATSMKREDFLKSQQKKFNWRKELLVEYSFKTLWAALVSTVVWASMK
ncbi:MAG: hypothetical protein HY537_08230 [Deltaproteobacteria bacterium]|nr:hypothetical protein [Deltaproteobacteria bacterium]